MWAAIVGYRSWRVFLPQGSNEILQQHVFNIAYHLGVSPGEIMTWPTRWRSSMWDKVLKQYEFEKSEAASHV